TADAEVSGRDLEAVATLLIDPSAGNADTLERTLAERLRAVAARRPVLVIVEDLQWADAASLAMLGSLVRGLGDAPVAWLFTLRPDDTRLAHLRGALGDAAAVTTLPPLATEDGRRLIERIAGDR